MRVLRWDSSMITGMVASVWQIMSTTGDTKLNHVSGMRKLTGIES